MNRIDQLTKAALLLLDEGYPIDEVRKMVRPGSDMPDSHWCSDWETALKRAAHSLEVNRG